MSESVNVRAVIDSTLAHINAESDFSSAVWLRSEFEDFTWTLSLESISVLDFRVQLEDGSLLTEDKNRPLLLFFKRFLLAQSNPQFSRGITYADSSIKGRIDPAIHICEYMLVRTAELKLGRFGLNALPSSFSHRMLHEISLGESGDSIYQFRIRLMHLLKREGANLSHEEISRVKAAIPSIARSGGCDELGLSEAEVQRARVWLWINNLYQRASYEGGSRFVVHTSRLSELLYPGGILRSKWRKPVINSLVIGDGPLLRREAEGVSVRATERAESAVRYYVRALSAAEWIGRFDGSIPRGLTEVVSDRQFLRQLPLLKVGRYTTLPCAVVLQSLRHAIEFSLDRGPYLLKAYLTIAEHATLSGATMTMAARELVKSGHPDLVAAGVECWSIGTELRAGRGRGLAKFSEKIEEAFFLEFRRGKGIYELLQVLWGSLLIAIGAVMARRQGELLDLKAGDLFDKSETRLKFHARKRNVGNRRETIMRPVPAVIVRLMKALEEMQRGLVRLGVLKGFTALLSFPRLSYPSLIECDDDSCNMVLDRFCDFFEVDKDNKGRRYYIRQHQLRRFFAMLFFWGNSFSGLETLRWFLGHVDVRHLYHYITESTPGEVLRSVKVDFAIEKLRGTDVSVDSLADVINARFNTTSIQLLDNAELAGVINELLEDGCVTIEPHFFEGHSGQEYVILIRIESEPNA